MGRKHKLRKFAEILSFPNVYENYNVQERKLVGAGMEPVDLKGKWASDHFKNDKPITLELACGAGEYALGLARMYPDRNFIGVDVKGNRVWKGARVALQDNLDNVAYLRTRIEILDSFFAPEEVSEIWITFADPFPRDSKEGRRLTAPYFLEIYRKILQKKGILHLKHDDPDFFQYSLDIIQADAEAEILHLNEDIYGGDTSYFPELNIKTHYELGHLDKGRTIRYVRFTL